MTREDAKKLVHTMVAAFPNYKPANLSETVTVWAAMLKDYDFKAVYAALQGYILTDPSGFAPTIGQLVGKMHSVKNADNELGEIEAWGLVYKAICNSNYNSQQEFEKLPPACRKAIGSADTLKEWAAMDIDTVKSVEQSHFIRNYRAALKSMKEREMIPDVIKAAIGQNEPENKQIEAADKVISFPEGINEKAAGNIEVTGEILDKIKKVREALKGNA